MRLATSRFLGNSNNLIFNAYALKSLNEQISNRDSSYGVSVDYPNDRIEMEFTWRDVQENFNPLLVSSVVATCASSGLGAVLILDLKISWTSSRCSWACSTIVSHGSIVARSRAGTFTLPGQSTGTSGRVMRCTPFLAVCCIRAIVHPFEIFPGVTLPPGEYRFTRFENTAASASRRRLQVFASWTLGNYWSGTANEFETRLTYRIPPWFTISFNASQTFAQLPQGNFVARILSGQVNYSASPFLSFSNLIQFDNRSRNLAGRAVPDGFCDLGMTCSLCSAGDGGRIRMRTFGSGLKRAKYRRSFSTRSVSEAPRISDLHLDTDQYRFDQT